MDLEGEQNTSTVADWWYRTFIDVPIKHESPYNGEAVSSQALVSPESPSLKRRRSDQSQDLGEKRQRVDSGSSATASSGPLLSDGFASLLAQATDAVIQQHAPHGNGLHVSPERATPSTALVTQSEHNGHEGRSNGFTSDPHLYMRILSLPILESLVRANSFVLDLYRLFSRNSSNR
jgi:protein TBF1